MERLSRYEQRLDMLIHRALRQLEKYRKRSRCEADNEAPQASAGAEDADRHRRARRSEMHSIRRNEAASKQRTYGVPENPARLATASHLAKLLGFAEAGVGLPSATFDNHFLSKQLFGQTPIA